MDPQKIIELAKLLRNNGDKILNSEFTLTLSGSLIRALNDSFTLIADSIEIGEASSFQVVKPINSKSPVFRDLQLVHDFVQKTTLLCIIHFPAEEYFEGTIDIGKFRALKRLEVQKTNVRQIVGIQPLRAQLQQLICVKSLRNIEDIITHCGGDNSNGFVWNELKIADFSYNNLKTVDTSLEFAQYLQHLNLRHNQLQSVAAIKWLPHLKTLDLSFNRLQSIPQFHMDAYKRLQSLNMSNNLIEDLTSIVKLDALTDLDISDNFLLDHSYLLPLSALYTLKFLNLYGNPLHCHPKHRLATAQYLHKNTTTVKFILDFEPLTKSEKAIIGTQQQRYMGALSRYTMRSSSASISTTGRLTPLESQTPASSVGSLHSFRLQDNGNGSDTAATELAESSEKPKKKRSAKTRTVEIEDIETIDNALNDNNVETTLPSRRVSSEKSPQEMTKSLLPEPDKEHLETKRHIETLREKYGTEWLQTGNAEMMNSVLGIESSNSGNVDSERNKSRQIFDEYIGDLGQNTTNTRSDTMNDFSNSSVRTSTPTDRSTSDTTPLLISPIKMNGEDQVSSQTTKDSTLYQSIDNSRTAFNTSAANQTLYESLEENSIMNTSTSTKANDYPFEDRSQISAGNPDEAEGTSLKNVYSSTADSEPEFSEPEDEETYIVYTTNRNEAIFLTKSENFLRERDTLTQRTKNKWSLKILESCDRIKSNTLRINFDTVKADKQERVYIFEEDLCQELEQKLRDILSQRDLSEMNQTIYRCVNCSCQFSHENKCKRATQDLRCPDCKSAFIAEIHELPKSLEKSRKTDKVSPAAIAEEVPEAMPALVLQPDGPDQTEETLSIGSANSLNDSSSCSKLTNTNSKSSFDSNQSVAGSTNTDRANDFKLNGESDVDIISNPSQSSIEVLDPHSSRKGSEERHVSQQPHLATIDDQSSGGQSFIDREYKTLISGGAKKKAEDDTITSAPAPTSSPSRVAPAKSNNNPKGPLAQFNLTESSSSGSVTDSICTTYEQKSEKASESVTDATQEFLLQESSSTARNGQDKLQHTIPSNETGSNVDSSASLNKKEDSGLTSMFGALFQSTNVLMTSSKKLIDAKMAATNVKPPTAAPLPSTTEEHRCSPYKFNYSDFNDIDHRLKLYFYQTKFEESDEHFKYMVRGRIFNENTSALCEGLLVVSTCKCYLMEAFAPEHDDVTKWLRQIVSCTVDRLELIQLLPWKLGFSFHLRDWGGFLLLLQDILRTDSLLLYLTNNALPSHCELIYQPADLLNKRLSSAVNEEQLKMCALLNDCEVTCENAKRTFSVCGLLTTDTRLYLTSQKLDWLSQQASRGRDADIELCVTQFMSNLVEVDRPFANVFTINFLDETHDKCELWKCTFETQQNAESCLTAIAQSWEQLFGVPLFNT